MTMDDNESMIKVGIAELRAHLSRYLRNVRRDQTLTVLDRDTPIARIVPYDAEIRLQVRPATIELRDLSRVRDLFGVVVLTPREFLAVGTEG